MDNHILDHSNMDNYVRENASPRSRHHLQENLDAQRQESLFGNYGYKILKQGKDFTGGSGGTISWKSSGSTIITVKDLSKITLWI